MMHTTKLLLLLAVAGHLLCGVCDCLLIYTPSGKFGFDLMKDQNGMREVFRTMPPRNPLLSMLLGTAALLLCSGGYYALSLWMEAYAVTASRLMLLGMALFFIPGAAHHVFCGAAAWFYIRLEMTEEAKDAVTDFFKQTSLTMIACYLGMILFSVTLFVQVASGATALPGWACVFNILLLTSVLFPLRVGGAGNWAGALMFLVLFFLL